MSILGQQTAQDLMRDGHQGGVNSGVVNPLHVEEWQKTVESEIVKQSVMLPMVEMVSIRGTDMLSRPRMGTVELQKVVRGVMPTDNAPDFDNISIRVDTMTLIRTAQHTIDDFQSSFDVRSQMGRRQAEQYTKFYDRTLINCLINAAQVTNVTPEGVKSGGWVDAVDLKGGQTLPAEKLKSAPKGFKGGNCVVLGARGDEIDPEIFEQSIQRLCQLAEEKDVDISGEAVLLLAPAQYYALLNNDKLINKDFSDGNGNFAQGTVFKANGLRIVKTNRLSDLGSVSGFEVGDTNILSNAANVNSYDVTQANANCVAVLHQKGSILVGETMPQSSKVFYENKDLQWYFDTQSMFGCTPDRAEYAGAIFKADPTQA